MGPWTHRCALCATLVAIAALSIAAEAGASGWVIVGPVQVLETCQQTARGPIFTDPQGHAWSLVVDPSDAAIANPGSGRFWPASTAWVEEALAALDPDLGARVGGRVVILPFPRRELTRSSCDGWSIYLSPGVQPLSRETVHFLLFHEVGHLIHRRLLPDWDAAGWRRYFGARGIDDLRRHHRAAQLGDQPHEVFAEDFRRLFGSPEARALEPLAPSSAPALEPRALAVRAFFIDLLERELGADTP
jgi:hypothetical protein